MTLVSCADMRLDPHFGVVLCTNDRWGTYPRCESVWKMDECPCKEEIIA